MTAPVQQKIQKQIDKLPADLIDPVMHWLERIPAEFPRSGIARVDDASTAGLVKLVACSEFAANMLIRHWPWFCAALESGCLARRPAAQIVQAALQGLLSEATDLPAVKRELRVFRNRQMLGILWRDINGSGDVASTLQDLSDLADALINCASGYVASQLATRFGQIIAEDGSPMALTVLAMGKLGGQELNFSSDVDLVFLYSGDGESNGDRQKSAHEYFTRWGRQLVSLLDDITEDGFVYRVDTRLRPFGDSGPLVVSYAALESYLLQHGRSWERYAYVKARVVAPANGDGVADDLVQELIRPFVYRRYLDYGVFESLREMKALISAEVARREMAQDIKLGPGGIREIEFIVQSLQLVRGGADRKLQGRTLLHVLPRLVESGGIDPSCGAALTAAYRFLRRLENVIQGIHDRQTHELPQSEADRGRVALATGFANWAALDVQLQQHRNEVSRQFAEVVFRGDAGREKSHHARRLSGLWEAAGEAAEWRGALEDIGVRDAEESSTVIAEFAALPAVRQIDSASRRRVAEFIPALLPHLRNSQRPAVVLQRVLRITEQILRRSAYLALLNENPAVLERLVDLCEGSAFLAEEIARFPILLDEMLDPRRYSAGITASDMRVELQRRMSATGQNDSEQHIETLAQFQRAMLFRIAVADFSGTLPVMKVSDRLTELAELVLDHALGVAWADLVSRHGEPRFDAGEGCRKAGFGVIAYGKLGGMELSYGSDLDLVFLHDSHGNTQQTEGERAVENSMFFSRLVRRLVHFLTTQTASGVLYAVDTRLRPDGRSGLLVTSIEAFERYQEENAWTWEHQALLRSRPVAGSATVARDFERVRSETLRFRIRRDRLLDDVLVMRAKMRKQLDRSTDVDFDLKQGRGGIGDIEFLVQYLVLKNATAHPAVIHYTDNIRQLGTLCAAGCLGDVDAYRLQKIYKDYRLRLHRLALDGRPPIVRNEDFIGERAEVRAIWDREMAESADPGLL